MTDYLSYDGLTLCIDFNSLPAYAALEATKQLVKDTGIRIRLVPMAKQQDYTPRQSSPDDPLAEYKAKRAQARKEDRQRERVRDCDRLGISVASVAGHFDTSVADSALLWMIEEDTCESTVWDYVGLVFSLTFRELRPPENFDSVSEILERCGVNAQGFEQFMTTGAYLDSQTEIEQLGLFLSPAYLYEGERYQGRQHLPLLRWIITGRKGTPPV